VMVIQAALVKLAISLATFFLLSKRFSMSPLPLRHRSEKGRGELRKEEVGVEWSRAQIIVCDSQICVSLMRHWSKERG
jgi:hypothetical protein